MGGVIDVPATVLCRSFDDEPVDGRLRLGEDLAVEGGEFETKVDFSDVFDVRVGSPPAAAADALSEPVLTVGFDRGEQRAVLFVDASESTLDNVAGVLYRRLLNDLEAAISHPSNIGGRVTDKSFEIGQLLVAPGKVGCRGLDRSFSIDLETVVDFSRSAETLLGERRPVITIKYVKQGVAVSLKLSLATARKQHLLGRFLRRDYEQIRRRLQRLDLPRPAVKALVKLYSLRGTASPQALLSNGSVSLEALVSGLMNADLVEPSDDGEVGLTPRGWILVTEHVGDGMSSLDPER